MSLLSQYEDALLHFIAKGEKSEQDIIDNFESKTLRNSQIKQLIKGLEKRDYIKLSTDALLVGAMTLDSSIDPSNSVYVYELRGMGEAYLNRQNNSSTVYSNITNSNIANNSARSIQSVQLSSQNIEIKQLVIALEQAAQERDPSKIKEIFGYIADKSIDVAIALVTGSLMR